MNVESRAAHVTRRKVAATVLKPFFRSERIRDPETDGLSAFEEKVASGYGGIIILKHFSLKDPPQAIKDIIFSSPVLVQKQAVAPNALHQVYPGVPLFGRLLDVKIDPIVTENTVKRALGRGKTAPTLNEGSTEFVRDAVDYLRQGQLIVIAPEGERRDNLEPYARPTIAALLAAAAEAGLMKSCF